MTDWNDEQPIYRQIRDRIVHLILDGTLAEGEAIPSVRNLAADYRINHLTVGKAYQLLVDDNVLEKRRGLGMYVRVGARQALQKDEEHQFMAVELPAFIDRIRQLGLDSKTVINEIKRCCKEEK